MKAFPTYKKPVVILGASTGLHISSVDQSELGNNINNGTLSSPPAGS